MSSILAQTKDLLGIPAEVTNYDTQLVLYINSVITIMNQLGIETELPRIESGDALEDLLPDAEAIHDTAQMYIYLKVRLMFDPPATSFVLTSLEKLIAEQEWRLTDYSTA